MKTALITGITGQEDGFYLTDYLLKIIIKFMEQLEDQCNQHFQG